uniref:Uncharacterized protein n=1 Tax=Propithecus coquereli TaxID=379532 RepID=A0A2K6EX58_PROCO
MTSPSHTPTPSPTQSPSQSRSNNVVTLPGQQPYSTPSPSPPRGSSRPPSHTPTPNGSQPSSRASSLTPSPHVQHVPRGSSQNPTPPASKSPSQSGFKSLSQNPSLTPAVPMARSLFQSPATSASYIGPIRTSPSYITPYVPRFLKEPPFFQPPTAPLPQNHCFPCPFPCPVLVSGKPHVVPTVLPATFYTPFSRYYSQPRPYRRRPNAMPLPSISHLQYDGPGRSVHFYRGS